MEAHSKWLLSGLAEGILKAPGPLIGTPAGERGALLIFTGENRADLDTLIATDPYSIQGLISGMEVFEWNPFFGAFQADSTSTAARSTWTWSRNLPQNS